MTRKEEQIGVKEIGKKLEAPLIHWFTIFVIFCLLGFVFLS